MHYSKSIPFTTFRRFTRMPCSRHPPHTSKHMKENLLLFTGLKQQELSAEWTTTETTVFCAKTLRIFPPKKHLLWLTFNTPDRNTWGSFAAGTLYTHICISTDIHSHAFVSIMSSEPHSDTRSKKSAKAQIIDPLWSCRGQLGPAQRNPAHPQPSWMTSPPVSTITIS